MSARTKPQIIIDDKGQPAFAVVPYEEYMALVDADDSVTIPHEVVELHAVKGHSLLKAWRLHRGMTQEDVANMLKVTQANISKLEKSDTPSHETKAQWAKVMDCHISQLSL